MRKSSEFAPTPDWKKLYLAALFETNKARIPAKIAVAQRELRNRRAELLNRNVGDASEIHALDTALFSLNALRNCLMVSASAVA